MEWAWDIVIGLDRDTSTDTSNQFHLLIKASRFRARSSVHSCSDILLLISFVLFPIHDPACFLSVHRSFGNSTTHPLCSFHILLGEFMTKLCRSTSSWSVSLLMLIEGLGYRKRITNTSVRIKIASKILQELGTCVPLVLGFAVQ